MPSIKGCRDIYYELGQAVPDLNYGIKAKNCMGIDISKLIDVDDSEVDWTAVGKYSATYTVKDNLNGKIKRQSIKINVSDGNPYFTGADDFTYIIGVGDFDYLNGIKAYDCNGNELNDIEVNPIIVNTDVPGQYNMTYKVTDKKGRFSCCCVMLTVRYKYPQIILNETSFEVDLNNSTELNEILNRNVKAYDEYNVEITDSVIIDTSEVDLDKVGDYDVYYTVIGKTGAKRIQKVTVTIVKADTDITAPEFKILAERIIYYIPDIGEEQKLTRDFFIKDIISANDDKDGDITDKIIVDYSGVDFKSPGTYKVDYSVEDGWGNKSVEKIDIQVIDRSPPIFFNLPDSFEYKIGDVEPNFYINGNDNINVIDNVDGKCEFTVESDVNFTKAGTYTVTYFSQDKYGNQTKEEIKINVKE